jgi:methylphosphotriester-DNA--protein-cysteine methyltransferase
MDKLTSTVALQAWPRPPLGAATLHQERVLNACRALEQSEAGLALDELARSAGMSTFHFHRVFKQVVGVTPKSFAKVCTDQSPLARKYRTSPDRIMATPAPG